MVPGLQIAGLFVAITAVLAFTAWAETWLASVTASRDTRGADAKPPGRRQYAEPRDQGDVIRAA